MIVLMYLLSGGVGGILGTILCDRTNVMVDLVVVGWTRATVTSLESTKGSSPIVGAVYCNCSMDNYLLLFDL